MFNKKFNLLFSLILFFSPTAFAEPLVNSATEKTANKIIALFANDIHLFEQCICCVCCNSLKKTERHLFIEGGDLNQLTKIEKMLAQRGPYEEAIDLLRREELKSVPQHSSLKRELDWAFPPIGMTHKNMYRHASMPYCLQ